MREFLKSFFSFGVATSIEKILAFILLPIYTRLFTTTEYGMIDLCQVPMGIVSVFALLQLETSLQRYYYKWEGDDKKIFLFSILITVISLSFFFSIIICLLSYYISSLLFSSSAYYLLVILSAIQLPFINFSMLGLIILRYEKKNLLFTYQVILKVVLLLLSVFVFVVFMDGGLEWVLICQLLTLVLTSIVLYTNIKQYLLFSFSWKNLMMSFSYALPQFPARVGSVMMVYSNRLFMVFFLTTSIIGLYSFSLKLASGVQILGTAFMMAWLPFMYQQFAKENHRLLFAKFMPLVSCFLFLLVSVLSLLSEDIVSIVAGPDFFYSYKYIGSLSLYFALTIIKEVIDIGPKYTEKTKYVSYNYFVSLIVNVVSMYLFIVFWGIEGVIYSMILTYLILVVISWIVSNKLYYIPFSKFYFVILILPALSISMSVMNCNMTPMTRYIILILAVAFYGIEMYMNYKKVKLYLS